MNTNKVFAAFALPLIAMSQMLPAARNGRNEDPSCAPTPPAACYEDNCCRTYCLGPENYGVNAAVNPRTCNGDWVVGVSGFYWNFHQDNMDFAINNGVTFASWNSLQQFRDAWYEIPKSNWDFGFKVAVGYNTTCDGWDFGLQWTRFHGSTKTHAEEDSESNRILLSLWSSQENASPLVHVHDIESSWSLGLDLVDFELGRAFWVSKRLALRPFVGLRYASIQQNYFLLNRGGEFLDFNDVVDNNNDFKGFGARGGLDSTWNLGCGWAFYGNLAFSLVYGRFNIDQDEYVRGVEAPFTKTHILELDRSFRLVRYMTDVELGVQWSTLFCDCDYAFSVSLGWEAHLFIGQNQMNRWNPLDTDVIQNTGLYGNLDTQGWTLSLSLGF